MALAGAAAGQLCTWEHLEVPPLHPGSASLVYHGGLQKLLLIGHGSYSHSPLLMWAWNGSAWIPIPSQGLSRRPESEVAPALNVDDFLCFMNRWALGCP